MFDVDSGDGTGEGWTSAGRGVGDGKVGVRARYPVRIEEGIRNYVPEDGGNRVKTE